MTTFSTALKLELPGDGQQSGTWGQTTNKNLGTLLEQAITGVQTITMLDANYTLTNLNGVSDESRNAVLVVGGTNSAIRSVIVPSTNKLYTIKNNTTGGFAILVKTSGGSGFSVQNGQSVNVYCDGTDVYQQQTMSVTPSAGDSSQAIATTAFVNSYLPVGMIVMWSGSIGSIPSGWRLCDGGGGTPNLRDRFIVGAGNTYAVGATGGSADATLVSHAHTYSSTGSGTTAGMNANANHAHGVYDPGHNHVYRRNENAGSAQGGCCSNGDSFYDSGTSYSGTGIGIYSANVDHGHSFSVSISGTTSTGGSSATNANLPPYYALAYIMKV